MLIPTRHEFWAQETARLLHRMEEAGVKVVVLDRGKGYRRWWETVAFRVARVFNRDVETRYAAVIYDGTEARVYLPSGQEADTNSLDHHILMRHECVHIMQALRICKGRLGAFLFSLAYLFCLPALWTMRAKWETEAYLESARVLVQAGVSQGVLRQQCNNWEWEFRSAAYFFMDPFRRGGFGPDGVNRWLTVNRKIPSDSPLQSVGFFPRSPREHIGPRAKETS